MRVRRKRGRWNEGKREGRSEMCLQNYLIICLHVGLRSLRLLCVGCAARGASVLPTPGNCWTTSTASPTWPGSADSGMTSTLGGSSKNSSPTLKFKLLQFCLGTTLLCCNFCTFHTPSCQTDSPLFFHSSPPTDFWDLFQISLNYVVISLQSFHLS